MLQKLKALTECCNRLCFKPGIQQETSADRTVNDLKFIIRFPLKIFFSIWRTEIGRAGAWKCWPLETDRVYYHRKSPLMS